METLDIQPINQKYFNELLFWGNEVDKLCRQNNIQPIVYGSLAYIFYTHDKGVAINDIDFLVPEDSFLKIIELVKTIPETSCQTTDWHSVIFFKDGYKIECDGIEYYLKNIDFQVITATINGKEFELIDKEALKSVYHQGSENIPTKKDVYSYKLQKLLG